MHVSAAIRHLSMQTAILIDAALPAEAGGKDLSVIRRPNPITVFLSLLLNQRALPFKFLYSPDCSFFMQISSLLPEKRLTINL